MTLRTSPSWTPSSTSARTANWAQNQADEQSLSDEYLGGVPVERLPADLADADAVAATTDVLVLLGETTQAGAL